jgi:hypothetical protein
MELNWLEDFLTRAERRNFSRAAEARHVTQPAFSRRSQALEAWVGTPLVVRSPQGVALNAAGEYLCQQAAGREGAALTSLMVGADLLVPVSAPNPLGAARWTLPGTPAAPVRLLAYSKASGLACILEVVQRRAARRRCRSIRCSPRRSRPRCRPWRARVRA